MFQHLHTDISGRKKVSDYFAISLLSEKSPSSADLINVIKAYTLTKSTRAKYKNMPATTAMNHDACSALRSRPIPMRRPIYPNEFAIKLSQATFHFDEIPLFI